jgi:hypothetical protein
VVRSGAGEVGLKLKAHWRDGTTRLVMSPLAFMRCLIVLVPSQHRPAPMLLERRPRELLLRGDQLRPLGVADGSLPTRGSRWWTSPNGH